MALRYLEDFPQLEHLHLRKGKFSASVIEYLFRKLSLSSLHFLSLEGCCKVNDVCMDALTECLLSIVAIALLRWLFVHRAWIEQNGDQAWGFAIIGLKLYISVCRTAFLCAILQ